MKKIAGILAMIILLVGSGAWFWDFQKTGPEEMDSVIVAYSPFESTARFLDRRRPALFREERHRYNPA